MARRVLVTRPEPGAGRTAARLAELGFEPVVLALTETRALPVDANLLPAGPAGVAVTSANAVRHAPKVLIERLAALPCHAVGRKTAQAARAAGFREVHEAGGDAEALAAVLETSYAGRALVYLCGRVRFPVFEERLLAAGAGVVPLETYDTIAVNCSDQEISRRLAAMPVDAVLLHSAKAAVAMQTLVGRPALAGLFGEAVFYCFSGRIATALGTPSGEKIRVAAEPNDEALLSLLNAGG